MLIPICGERLPVKLDCSVISAKGLPVMNKSINSTDAFVEIRFEEETMKTEVVTSLNPAWDGGEVFTFDCDEKMLCTELLELRVMDHDTYSANDPIGRIYLDCNIFLEKMRAKEEQEFEEQFTMPIYDTLNGIRGDLTFKLGIHLLIEYDYKNYVQILSGSQLPMNVKLVEMIGFVSDIKIQKDPDYEWFDKIRSPRQTNEARQSAIRDLMRIGAVSIANKADKYQANLVLGYCEHIDVEGSATDFITLRVYGTAIKVVPLNLIVPLADTAHFPLLTIGWVPHAKQIGIGSLISTRTIRILEDVEEAEAQRKTWWNDLRTELHQQCTSLGCDLIIGYAEHVAIHEGVMLLGCSGTAVLTGKHQATFYLSGPRGSSTESDAGNVKEQTKGKKQSLQNRVRGDTITKNSICHHFHTSLLEGKTNFTVKTQKCNVCKRCDVMDFLVSTAPCPSPNCYQGPRNHVQVSVTKRITSNSQDTEEYAHELSNILPFADHELFHGLILEMKSINTHANAVFDCRFTYSISDDLLICVLTGVIVHLQCMGKEEGASPLLTNVLGFASLQKHNDARRFSWGTVREAIRFRQPTMPSVTLKILMIKSPVLDTPEENSNSKGRLRLNTIVDRFKKKSQEKDFMTHFVAERQISTSIGVVEPNAAANANAVSGIHFAPTLNSLIMNRETAESCSVIGRWSDVFVREDLNNSVKDAASLDIFVMTALEERITQIRAVNSLAGQQCSISNLKIDCPQFTISREHAHMIIYLSCDIYSVDF